MKTVNALTQSGSSERLQIDRQSQGLLADLQGTLALSVLTVSISNSQIKPQLGKNTLILLNSLLQGRNGLAHIQPARGKPILGQGKLDIQMVTIELLSGLQIAVSHSIQSGKQFGQRRSGQIHTERLKIVLKQLLVAKCPDFRAFNYMIAYILRSQGPRKIQHVG